MDAGTRRNAALGMAVTLAAAVLLALLWSIGSATPVRANNLDVCASGCLYTTIQDAVYAAQDGDTIRVAAGSYAGSMTCDVWDVGTFTSTLCITEDIMLLGGYNPADFSVREPDQYTTTVRWEGEPGDVIVITLANGTTATVDGFQITGATGGSATAVWVRDTAPTISHNRIIGNDTTWWGAGIFVSGSSAPTIEANEILSNTAESGGGVVVRGGATAAIQDNLIAYNEAITNAGGIYVTEGSVVTITNNHFLSNTAADNGGGGGILVENGSTFVMSGNTFEDNFAGCCGGGMAAWWDTTGTISGNDFVGNTAGAWMGGGIYLDGGPFNVVSNTIAANHATASLGGGISVIGADTYATLVGNVVMSNTALEGGGGISIDWGPKATVQSNQILSNTSEGGIGSGIRIVTAEVLVDKNLLSHNVNDDLEFGNGTIGVAMDGPSRPVTITNNVIVDNVDKGIMVSSDGVSDLRIVNNTIAANRNEGVLVWGTNVVQLLRNNVIASNEWCGVAAAEGADIQNIDYNDVWNNGGGGGDYCDYGGAAVPPAPGPGSISIDPRFVDATAGDYHLSAGSPAIDGGTSDSAPSYDKDGVSRPQMGGFDMGAYEQVGSGVFLPLLMRNSEPSPTP